jgi:hypothetical protein
MVCAKLILAKIAALGQNYDTCEVLFKLGAKPTSTTGYDGH